MWNLGHLFIILNQYENITALSGGGALKREGLQAGSTPKSEKLKSTAFVDTVMKFFLRDLALSQNQLLKSADE